MTINKPRKSFVGKLWEAKNAAPGVGAPEKLAKQDQGESKGPHRYRL